MLTIAGIIIAIVVIWGVIYLAHGVYCMFFLPPGHPCNVRFRRRMWQAQNPGKKHPFKY